MTIDGRRFTRTRGPGVADVRQTAAQSLAGQPSRRRLPRAAVSAAAKDVRGLSMDHGSQS